MTSSQAYANQQQYQQQYHQPYADQHQQVATPSRMAAGSKTPTLYLCPADPRDAVTVGELRHQCEDRYRAVSQTLNSMFTLPHGLRDGEVKKQLSLYYALQCLDHHHIQDVRVSNPNYDTVSNFMRSQRVNFRPWTSSFCIFRRCLDASSQRNSQALSCLTLSWLYFPCTSHGFAFHNARSLSISRVYHCEPPF